MKSEITNLSARLAIADAILEVVRESGLLRPKRRTTRKGKARTRKPRQAAKPAQPRKSGKRAPLNNVPETTE